MQGYCLQLNIDMSVIVNGKLTCSLIPLSFFISRKLMGFPNTWKKEKEVWQVESIEWKLFVINNVDDKIFSVFHLWKGLLLLLLFFFPKVIDSAGSFSRGQLLNKNHPKISPKLKDIEPFGKTRWGKDCNYLRFSLYLPLKTTQ